MEKVSMPDSLVFKSVTYFTFVKCKNGIKSMCTLKKKKKKHVYLATSKEDNMEGG